MTKKEAEKEVEKINRTGPTWFCPLIRGQCVSECVNFSRAGIYNENSNGNLRDTKDDNYQIYSQHCHNGMFLDPIICPMEISDE